MNTHKDSPKIAPMFRLEDLGMDDETTTKLEAYFAQHLVDLESAHMLNEIPGLSHEDICALELAIRDCYSRARGSQSPVDLGIGRLLRDVGKIGARGVKLGQDFYNLTPERERMIREILQWLFDSYFRDVRATRLCMTLLYGMDGNLVHTYTSCVERKGLRDYSTYYLRKLVERKLRELATYLVPVYARETFQTADQITLCYLQLKTRSYNILAREGITTVAELIIHTPDELLLIPGFGFSSLKDVERGLKWCNFSLAQA